MVSGSQAVYSACGFFYIPTDKELAMKPLNHLTGYFTESVIRMMSRICNQAGGLNLAQGFPDFDAPEPMKQAAQKAIQDGYNQYAITFGQPCLRKAIAAKAKDYNGIECDPDTQITVTCGATEAMISCLKALINPGDEVIVFEPFYENYGPDSLLSGATPRYVTLHAPDWSFDPDELAEAFNDKTKAVVINTPNNPTGKVFSREELTRIAELCQKWDTYCIMDDIYEHILFDGAEHVAMATIDGMADRTLTINSVSKTYSATGWRIGWVIASPEVTQGVRKIHDFLTVGAPAPLQEAVVTALELPQSYYGELAARYEKARRFLYDVLDEQGFNPNLPKGAYYIMTDVAELMERFDVSDDFNFAKKLIELTGVASVPGSSFYAEPEKGSKQVRFCFCKKMETLEDAAQRLRKLSSL
ncbi:aminotransferase [Dethiosulfatarculus sandiegensis]|uniref:Aminotransferase n=2 Tax=Dethiosulfatarculus sandiegensis TaxID=1429043 RepID=A0A0D2IYS8_9BACT|nr:aminotransferase [Dethiosulfatarculus sandiegensis]